MIPCVALPLPPAAVAPLASAWKGLLLLPFAASPVARPRRGRPHAPAAAAAPHHLPVPVLAPVGGRRPRRCDLRRPLEDGCGAGLATADLGSAASSSFRAPFPPAQRARAAAASRWTQRPSLLIFST
eukprot:TRINITY_DN5626_c0_g1_i1.p5 TRINITY_DN5626_c0_g1~~TRINITY_DN5626_c0_g1_i1.p5  ORF type:complete len:127 (+),score=11.55 TRINITY_DN5626_c0_g1_i1:579-959(+)